MVQQAGGQKDRTGQLVATVLSRCVDTRELGVMAEGTNSLGTRRVL